VSKARERLRQERQPFQDTNQYSTFALTAFHGQYKLAAGDHKVASAAWFGLLGARANDGIKVLTRNPSILSLQYYTATCFRLIGVRPDVFSRLTSTPTPVRVDERTTGRIWKTQRMKKG
jgi:hypothetical protein